MKNIIYYYFWNSLHEKYFRQIGLNTKGKTLNDKFNEHGHCKK